MAERPSIAVSDTDGIITVEDHRVHVGGQYYVEAVGTPRAGYLPGIPAPLVTDSSTPDGFVHVAAFARVQTSSRGQGSYQQALDARKDIDILGTEPADSTNDRIDLIVGQQSDEFYGDTKNTFDVRHVVGEPSSTPTAPDVDGSPDWYEIAQVLVEAGTDEITQDDITQGETPLTVPVGGALPVADQAERDDIADPYSGFTVWRVDRLWLETWDGTGWRVQGVAEVDSVSDLDTLITGPYDGQLAMVGPDDQLYQFDGSAWTTYPLEHSAILKATLAQSVSSDVFDEVEFDTTEVDIGGMADVDTNQIHIDEDGIYDAGATVAYDADGTGGRFVYVSDFDTNEVLIAGAAQGQSVGAVYVTGSRHIALTAGTNLHVETFQDSGATLDTTAPFAAFWATLLLRT